MEDEEEVEEPVEERGRPIGTEAESFERRGDERGIVGVRGEREGEELAESSYERAGLSSGEEGEEGAMRVERGRGFLVGTTEGSVEAEMGSRRVEGSGSLNRILRDGGMGVSTREMGGATGYSTYTDA
jgi:hypothetical protein